MTGPACKNMSNIFEGRHKTGPCMRQTWLYVIVSMRNLNLYSVIFLISHEVGRRILLRIYFTIYLLEFNTLLRQKEAKIESKPTPKHDAIALSS